MAKGKHCRCISIAGISLSLLMIVGLILGQAVSLERQPTPTSTNEWSIGETTGATATTGDSIVQPGQLDNSMALAAILDDGFWYQGLLTDGEGTPVTNTNINITFRLYDVSVGGESLDSTVITVNTDGNGLFNEEIDFNNPKLFDGRALYLGMQVQGEASEMTPRQYLRPVPYAMSIRPGGVIRTDSSASTYDPVLEIRHDSTEASDLDGLIVYVESEGEAIEGRSKYGKGVYGSTDVNGTTSDAGVYGHANGDAPGVRGYSQGDSTNSYGGYFTSANRRGLYAEGGSGFFAAYFQGDGPNGVGIHVYGDVYATGDLEANGTKPAVVQAGDYGVRKLYSLESPNVWFEDFGQDQLVSGQATVAIEPVFLSTINTDVPYHVFVTPLGDCNGLYVINKTATSFEVRELGGGISNVAFDYRIAAIRKGYEGVRMELATGEGGRPLESAPSAPSEVSEPDVP
jgi:hypothetical protein